MKTSIIFIPKLLVGLGLAALVGFAASGRAPDGEWVATYGRADDRQAYCDAHFKGSLCAEWCEGFEGRPTGYICCVPAESVNLFPARQSDCLGTPP